MGKTVQRAGHMNELHMALLGRERERGWLIISTQGSFYRFWGLPFLMATSFHYVWVNKYYLYPDTWHFDYKVIYYFPGRTFFFSLNI